MDSPIRTNIFRFETPPDLSVAVILLSAAISPLVLANFVTKCQLKARLTAVRPKFQFSEEIFRDSRNAAGDETGSISDERLRS